MTTIDTRPDDAVVADDTSPAGVEQAAIGTFDWLTTTDHKRIGRMFAASGLVVLLAAAVIALLLGIERAGSGSFLADNALLQLFQMYRVGLVFGGVLPLTLGVAIAVVPMQLGARSIAFPRLALTSMYTWLGGLALTMSALAANGGFGGGNADMVDLFLAGIGLMAVALTAAAGCVATSILTTRAPGMTMRRVGLFSWASLIGALGTILVLPVVLADVIYLFIDHRLGTGANFGPVEQFNAWLGWAFSVPAVIAFAIPALGVSAELIPVTFKARQPMRGVKFAGIALVGITAFAAATQQVAQDVTFDTNGETFVRGAAPWLVLAGLPLLGLVICLLGALLTVKDGVAHTRPSIRAPFVFGLFGTLMIGAGIAANFVQGITDLDLVAPGYVLTSFEEGATLLVVYGAVLGAIGGLLFWAPKLWGRVIADVKVLPLALLGLAGTALAGGALLVGGFFDLMGGVPGSDADVAAIMSISGVDGGSLWVTLSLVGQGLVALTVLATLGLFVAAFTGDGETADDNPYGGHTIEWSLPSPAPAHNYENVPTVASAEPLFDLTNEGSTS